MAVAVKNTPDTQTRTGISSLALASLLGAVYILGGVAVVAWGVPFLWHEGVASHLPASLSFVSVAGLIVVLLVAIGLLAALGTALVGPNPPKGLRAGVFTVLAGLFVIGLVTVGFGRLLEGWFAGAPAVGMALTAAIGLGLLVWGWILLNKPRTAARLQAFEDQNWFRSARYKGSQGQRVRRATMLGILLLAGAGIYSLYSHGTLVTAAKDWAVRIPFSDRHVPLLPDVQFTVPLLLAAAALWLAYRVVNLPVFADFLIATEAEVNKVSWPTRHSVIQDTVVVLTTVLLLTVFLFVVDIAWGWLLSRNVVGVLRVDPNRPAINRDKDKDITDW
jgi:preprotein translocase SecE subunit